MNFYQKVAASSKFEVIRYQSILHFSTLFNDQSMLIEKFNLYQYFVATSRGG